MKTKVNRVINITETVETEVEFPKYTTDGIYYYKYYGEEYCVSISTIGTFATINVTGNSKGEHLFDTEITESKFNEVMAKVSKMIMPELQQKQETI